MQFRIPYMGGVVVLLAAMLSACGGDAFDKAGPLVLLSVEPVVDQEVSTDNLMPNPFYAEMYAGAPAPIGWLAPTDREASVISRKPVQNEEGNYLIQQWWENKPSPRGLADFFKTEMIHLEPHTRYLLKVTSINVTNTSANVSVGQMTLEGDFTYLARDLIVVEPAPKERRFHEAEFETGSTGDIFICTHRNDRTTYDPQSGRAVLLWLDWSLTEVGPVE